MLRELNDRSQEIFRHVVEAYVETGEAVGSKTLSTRLGMRLSSATIRNVMSDLEGHGLLRSPHTSAGRLPTEEGLRLFVHGLLEVGDLSRQEQDALTATCGSTGRSFSNVLEEATSMLSGLSQCAGLVTAPKSEKRLKHIEFVSLSPGRALVVMITEDGFVENRVIEVPLGLPPSSLVEASNYLNACLVGKTLKDAKARILGDIQRQSTELDESSSKVVGEGLAVWAGQDTGTTLIVKGQANLLNNVRALDELDQLRSLFDALEAQKEFLNLLDAAIDAEGVQIFIGAQNELFNHSGCSLIVAPYSNEKGQVIGALGVVGPARINYARIIPMVDFTAKLIGRIIG